MKCLCNYAEDMRYRDMPTVKYNDRFDSYYCEKCDVWITKMCNCGTCEFSGDRPERPSEYCQELGE